ncbi:DNA-methyltransferase [Pseudoalteromonas sp. 1_2015MBL_MicDiv]|uniref:DNA-methyltransferase n=1 Tax=Pseudoalteromonas sp. 1_2015MBL_MicDiv TaxID=1720343 RepID=UPI0012FE4F00|nr:site-specific DNA-methyltransferase [Pseudoalteromonas sp. 1_2015MBL_MicDiv]
MLDHIFGAKNFQSEIIWAYKRWSNSKKGLLPSHQNIYFYSKTKDFKFNTLYKPYSETTNIDQILQRRTRDRHNKSVYDKDSLGNSINGAEKKGVPLSDVWDIPYLNPKAKERVGYPTQKPLLLLEQVINLVTAEGDIVLDPFCGSGTTCVAAKLLGRNFIGIDESLDAVNLSKDRIDNPIKTESNLLKNGRDSYNNVEHSVLNFLKGIEFNPIQRNKGIDAILIKQYEGTPVLVKVQKDNETLGEAIKLLSNAMKTKKAKKAFLIQTSDENELYKMDIENFGMSIIISPALELSRQLAKIYI